MTGPGTKAPVIAVVGGGITGLAAAWEIIRRNPEAQVHVLEADDHLGGKIRTGVLGGRPMDLGPDAFVARRPEARALCAELGLDGALVAPGRRGASVWARGRLRPLPAGLALGIPTRIGPLAASGICSPSGLGRAAADLLRWVPRRGSGGPERLERPGRPDQPDRSVGDIVGRLGPEVVERLADPLIGGIHAGSVHDLSAAAVFPPLLKAAEAGGSLMRALRSEAPAASGGGSTPSPDEPVFLGLVGGMEGLVTTLAAELADRGVQLRLGTAVESITSAGTAGAGRFTLTLGGGAGSGTLEADGVVVAVPGPAAAAILTPLEGGLAQLLSPISYASVALVTLRMTTHDVDVPTEGTGFLVPRGEKRFITACTWMTAKWPHLAADGEHVLRASTGRYGNDRSNDLDDQEVVARTLDDLRLTMGLRGEPLEAAVTRWPSSFPQYMVGHLGRVADIEAAASRGGALAVAGAALHGVGIPACIGSGRRAAATVLQQVGATGAGPRTSS